MKHELLAPAGDIEAGYAALYYGADAVYLGLKQFSARATAQNFDEAELNEFVGFGIQPDIVVEEDVDAFLQNKDNVLEKALEILKY